jgi:hypothetical protein
VTYVHLSSASFGSLQAGPATLPPARWPAKYIFWEARMESLHNAIKEHLTSFNLFLLYKK